MDIVKMRYNYRKLIGLVEKQEGNYQINDYMIDHYGRTRVMREYINLDVCNSPEEIEDVTEEYGKL
jgi:hypothetical protein